MTTELSPTVPKPVSGTFVANVLHCVRWFLDGDDSSSRTVTCPKGVEADAVAGLVAAIRAEGEVRIVVAAPTRGDVVQVAGVLAAALGRNPSGFARVGIGLRNVEFPPDVGNAHPTFPVQPSMVPVRSITAAKEVAPECDLMIVTGIHPMTALDVAGASRNAARLIVLRPSSALCPQPEAHSDVEGTCLDGVSA